MLNLFAFHVLMVDCGGFVILNLLYLEKVTIFLKGVVCYLGWFEFFDVLVYIWYVLLFI